MGLCTHRGLAAHCLPHRRTVAGPACCSAASGALPGLASPGCAAEIGQPLYLKPHPPGLLEAAAGSAWSGGGGGGLLSQQVGGMQLCLCGAAPAFLLPSSSSLPGSEQPHVSVHPLQCTSRLAKSY